jgi:hypothetical protein
MAIRAAPPIGQCQSVRSIAKTDEANASTEPTDRSIPPTMRTNVMPTATIVKSGIELAMVVKVAALKNVFDLMENPDAVCRCFSYGI